MRDWKAEITSRLSDASDVHEDVLEEVAQHLDARYHALIGRGLAEDRAYTETLEELADSAVVVAMLRPARKPPLPDVPARDVPQRGWSATTLLWVDHLRQDLRLALRTLGRTPAFTVGAVLPLALGLAIATCAVAVMNAYLLRVQPYPAADRVYHVRYAPPGPWEPNNLRQLDWAAAERPDRVPAHVERRDVPPVGRTCRRAASAGTTRQLRRRRRSRPAHDRRPSARRT